MNDRDQNIAVADAKAWQLKKGVWICGVSEKSYKSLSLIEQMTAFLGFSGCAPKAAIGHTPKTAVRNFKELQESQP